MDLGTNENLFGGRMLAWIDEAAATYACSVCNTHRMLTVKLSEVIFKKPVKVGNIINIYGEVNKMGNTSISIKITAKKYNVFTESEIDVCTTDITFVRVDDEGSPIPIADNVKLKYKK